MAIIDPDLHATNPIVRCEYDGLNRRIVKELDANADGTLNETRHFYYNDRWQVVEERVGTDGETARVDCQYVWHPEYVDALAMRYWDSNASGGPDTAHYYLQDANYNVTALVNSSGDAVERYAYTPYGKVTVLNGANGTDLDGSVTEWADDSSQAGSDVKNVYLYTGRELDWETGLQINRNRYLHLQLGRWVSRDHWDDDTNPDGPNLYQFVSGNPAIRTDATGLWSWPWKWEWRWWKKKRSTKCANPFLTTCIDQCKAAVPDNPAEISLCTIACELIQKGLLDKNNCYTKLTPIAKLRRELVPAICEALFPN